MRQILDLEVMNFTSLRVKSNSWKLPVRIVEHTRAVGGAFLRFKTFSRDTSHFVTDIPQRCSLLGEKVHSTDP